MLLVGTRGQQSRDLTLDASGTITTASTPQLILPERKSTSSLIIQNISSAVMYIGIGSAQATASISGGSVSSITVANGGFGFTYAPDVQFLGGGILGNNTSDGGFNCPGVAGYQSPSRPARGHAVLTSGVLTSIVIDDPGAGYANAPFVFITNSLRDPFGCFSPSSTSAGSILLPSNGGNMTWNGTSCFTDAVSIYSATQGAAYSVKWSM